MTFVTVRCLYCDSEQVVKRGKTGRGKQRYLCQSTSCAKGSFRFCRKFPWKHF